jgi:hypothetical protein
VNLLWSYAYARKANLIRVLTDDFAASPVSFFADSGAHSARTLGITIGVDDYAAWVKHWAGCFTVYANLDVIYAAEATRINQRILEEQHGLHPMPVFHTGEPFTVLERYLAEGYTYIALGKLLGNPWVHLAPWIEKCFRMAEGTAVFHGFGLTAWQAIREFPFFSVDSSSWGSPYRFGTVRLFDRGRWTTVRVGNRDSVNAARPILAKYGVPWQHLSRAGFSRSILGELSAESYLRAGEWVAEQHGKIVLPKGKGYPPRRNKALPNGGPTVLRAGHRQEFTMYLAETAKGHHMAHARAVNERSQ